MPPPTRGPDRTYCSRRPPRGRPPGGRLDQPDPAKATLARRLAVGVAALAFLLVVARLAWVGDDAQITFRVAEHVLAGRGPRWNVAERVQVFTHPLWLLVDVAARAVGGDHVDSLLTVSVALAAATAVRVGTLARSTGGAVLAVAALAASKSVAEYATSGLENPLAYLLLAALLAVRTRRPDDLLATSLLTGALGLTRLDLLLMAGPALLDGIRVRRAVLSALVGLAPLAAWSAFALVYYGSIAPNTAPAKLGHGLPRAMLAPGVVGTFAWQAAHDPLSLVLIAAGGLVATRTPRTRPFALGLGAYVAYLGWIGGDFMGGRFLAAPTVLAVGLLAVAGPRVVPVTGALAAAGLVAAGAVPVDGPLRGALLGTPVPEHKESTTATVDERLWWLDSQPYFARPFPDDGGRLGDVVVAPAIGRLGLDVGPFVHVVDPMALTDPFLARLPAAGDVVRAGHYLRHVPIGYRETLAGASALVDPELRELYDRVALVARGPLWAPERWRAIAALTLHPPDVSRWHRPAYDRVPLALLHDENLPLWLPEGGTTFELPGRRHPHTVVIGLFTGTRVDAVLLRDGAEVGRVAVEAPPRPDGPGWGSAQVPAAIPDDVRLHGLDAVRLVPSGPPDTWTITAFRVE